MRALSLGWPHATIHTVTSRSLRNIALGCLILALTEPGRAGAAGGDGSFRLPGSGQSIKGQIMLLGIDDRSQPFRRNPVLTMSKPGRPRACAKDSPLELK